MAKRKSYRRGGKSSFKRAGGRSGGGKQQTVRIVLQHTMAQPGVAVAPDGAAMVPAGAPRRAQF